MQIKSKEIKIAIIILISYLLYDYLEVLPLALIGIDISHLPAILIIMYNLIYECFFIFIILLVYKKDLLNDLNDFKRNFSDYFNKFFEYWLILLGLMILTNYSINLIMKLCNHKVEIAQNEQLVRNLLKTFPIYTFITSSFLAPLLEELVFRKTTRKLISNKYLYIIISGLFFGTMHVIGNVNSWFDLLYIISYSIPGFIFAYTYVKSNNIFVSIGIHFIHNTVSILLQLLLIFL